MSAGAIAAAKFAPPAFAQDAARHGMSAFGDLLYPADFPHFNYVNPNAPKGGVYSENISSRGYNGSFLTFNSLNAYILKGEGAFGMDNTFASLMARSADEPDAMYGLAARSVVIADNGLTYRFALRPEAKFHDGTPLTAHDVVWSLMTLKDKGHPIITQSLRDFKSAEAADDATVVLRFAEKRARDVPLFVAGQPIFSKAYYAKQAFDESTLEIPLGSGPYKVGRFDVGHFIEFDRVKDWWGADLPVSRGQGNFDTVRYEYYRDREVAFVGFTAKNYLFHEEFTSRTWATRYDFPAIKDGRVKRDVIPDDTPSGAQGWFINTRREKFKDRETARSADRRLRFRMDQQEHHVRGLRPHRLGVPELAADGQGQAGRRGARVAGAVPRQAAGRSVRRTLSAAGHRRQRARTAAGCGAARNCSTPPGSRSRTASACSRTASR